MGKRARIALLIDTSTSWGSGLIEGVSEFAHTIVDWQFFLGPRGKYDRFTLPRSWCGDGVIARVTHQALADEIVERQIPAVNVSWYRYAQGAIPQCTCDEALIGRMAADFFIDRGFRQFAYCGSSLRPDYEDNLGKAFAACVAAMSFRCHSIQPKISGDPYLPSEEDLDQVVSWLGSLPKPIGLLAFDCLQARQIIEACHLAGIDVPQGVSVLGGEHDLLSCTISKPELSSIDHSPRKVGWAAAEMLARILNGDTPATPMLLPPARVIARQSTDVVAINDDLLSMAIHYIKDHSQERLQVADILRHVPISRRALEKGFRKVFGRSPAESIRRVRVDHAVQLLCDTSWAMPRIASMSGFERPELLTRAFRRELGTTPSEFRRQHHMNRHDPIPLDEQSAAPSLPRL